jgi:hypothetical protein
VLTADVRFEGWTTEDWRRVLQLFKPRASPAVDATRPRGGLIAIRDHGRVRKLLHTRNGRIDPPAAGEPLASIATLAERHHASWAVALSVGALEEVMERFGARCRRSDNLLDQTLKLGGIVRELMHEGMLESWPERLRGVPVPTAAMAERTLDTLCADGHVICLGMFKDEGLYTSLVARRRGRAFDLIAGPDEIRAEMGLLSGDFRRDQRYLVHAVEDLYGPLSLGCFAEFDVFRELQMDARPGAWSRAIAIRDVILSPLPGAIAVALGFDGVRVLAENVRSVTRRFDAFGFAERLLEPSLESLRKRLGSAAGEHDVENVLGFDPLAVLRALLRR